METTQKWHSEFIFRKWILNLDQNTSGEFYFGNFLKLQISAPFATYDIMRKTLYNK